MARQATATAKKVLATKTSMLRVPLTRVELEEVAEQMGRTEGDLRAFYAHKKEVTADLKAKEELLDGALSRLGRLQRDKHEYRPVPVRVEADYRVGKVFEIREDTGEVVAERSVNEQDRQATLFDGKPVDPDDLVGTREDAVARHKAGKGELAWEEQGENLVAKAPGGTYCIEPGFGGGLNVLWTPEGGRSGRIATEPAGTKRSEAQARCERDNVQRQADELLRNAGSGELAKKGLTGPAEKFKKGGRR